MIDIELPSIQPTAVPKPREFLIPLPQEGNYLLILDNTALEHITKCPTSALNYLIHHRQAHARNAALTFGGAIHEGIKSYLLGESAKQQDQHIVNYFAENPTPPDEYRTAEMAIRVMQAYRLQDTGWDILRNRGEKLIEKAFEIPLGRLDVNADIRLPEWPEPRRVKAIHVAWSGRIDLVAHVNGHNRIVDHKTSSLSTEQYVQQFALSHQTIGYTWVSRILWPELDVTGFCLDAIALRRCTEDTINLLSKGPRGGDPPLTFFKAYFDYNEEHIERWEANTLAIISDFVHCIVRDFFPMFTNSCFGKYGRCQFHDACTIENEQVRMRFLQGDAFKTVTWLPTL